MTAPHLAESDEVPLSRGNALRVVADEHLAPDLNLATRRLVLARRLNWAPADIARVEQELLEVAERVVELLRTAGEVDGREDREAVATHRVPRHPSSQPRRSGASLLRQFARGSR